MSIKTWKGALLCGVIVVGGGGYFGFMSMDVADGLGNERDDPRLVTAGTVKGQEWAMVMVGSEAFADCIEFRTGGARQLKLCGTTTGKDRYEVAVTQVRGVTMFAAVLPEEAVAAEIALESDLLLANHRGDGTTAPVKVHSYGSVRYVVGAAPAGARWRDYEDVPLVVTDAKGARLTP